MVGIYLLAISLIINLLCFLLGKKSKIAAFVHVSLLWLITVFTSDVVDYSNYNSYFLRVQNGFDYLSTEVGFGLVNKIFSSMKFDFQVMRAVLITVVFVMFILAFKKIGGSPNFVAFCFTLYPLFIDVIQIRTLVATAFLTIGVVYYLYEKKYFKYIICILIASSFHISFLIYLIFLLNEKILSKIVQRNSLIVIGFLGCFAFYLGGKNIPFINAILFIVGGQEKYETWLSNSGKFGFLYFAVLVFLSIVITRTLSQKAVNKEGYVDLVYRLNIMSICFIPFIMLASTFGRLVSNMCLVNYLAWQAQYFDGGDFVIKSGKIPFHRVFIYLCIFVYIAIWLNLEIIPEFETRIMPFFENNYFFS